jgi:Flp pilus assembly protein TadG
MALARALIDVTRNNRGTSVIELGLIAPLLITMMMGIIDFGRAFTHKFAMEQATYRTLEKITAGSRQSDYVQFKSEAATAAGEPEANVTIESWLECDGMKQADFNTACTDTQQVSRFVRVAIVSDFQLSFPTGPLANSLGHANSLGQIKLAVGSTLRVQ